MTTRTQLHRVCSVGAGLHLLLLPSLAAQSPSLVADINAINVTQGSEPEEFTRVANTVFFAAETRQAGRELFATSGVPGSPTATRLVRDIRPGTMGSSPRSLVAVGNLLCFVADDGIHGFELWRSDGTVAGTVLVKDVLAGSTSADPAELTVIGGVLYFTADDGVHGRELWRSDGTTAGTMLVRDIVPGSNSRGPELLVAAGNTLFFSADDGTHGFELWKCDGTTAGTVLVRDIRPLGEHGAPRYLTALGSSVVFTANDGVAGEEPWVSDGTANGTVLLHDVAAGPTASQPVALRRVGSSVYFFGRYTELWRTDGTPQGTTFVTSGFGIGWDGVELGGQLVFVAQAGNTSSLWRSDGTALGTSRLVGSWPLYGLTQLRTIGSTLFFQANPNTSSNQGSLWKSDGTLAGTTQVTRIRTNAGSIDGGPTEFTPAGNGLVVFAANDGLRGREPWVTDGTAAGTRLLADVEFDPVPTLPSRPRAMIDLFGTCLLVADDGIHGEELWRTDGTNQSTWLVRDIRPGPENSMAYGFVQFGNRVFFSADDGVHGQELWCSDGTAAGTHLVKDIVPGANPASPEGMVSFRGELWFAAAGGLWRSDGTAAGTALVVPVAAAGLTACDGFLLFAGTDTQRGTELWISDGTVAGTQLLKDIDPVVTSRGPLSSNPQEFVQLGGTVYFTAATQQHGGRDLWQTDGTTAGTQLAVDVEPGSSNSVPFDLLAVGSRLFFSSGPLFGGFRYLWTSDGTLAGTSRVSTLAIDPAQLRRLGDRVVFTARDPFQTELWISDGTAAGTFVVKDIHPTASSYPAYLTAIGTRAIWFQADDGTHGTELWVTDGTQTGTRLVADIDPRPVVGWPPNYVAGASYPWLFTLSGGRVLFAADDGSKGYEPWMVFPGATAQFAGEGCAPNGRPPSLQAPDPVLGSAVTVGGDNIPGGSAAIVTIVAFRRPQPLAISWRPGCSLYVDPNLMVTFWGGVPSGGRWSLPLSIPNVAALSGLGLAVQAMFVITSPAPTEALSNGIYWTLGS